MSKIFNITLLVLTLFTCAGCATPLAPAGVAGMSAETPRDQLDAARKVVGGMVAGSGRSAVIKYSPTTGKHYSGNLDVDPETGEKLEVLAE